MVCYISAVLELTLALASFSACLHYDDIVERLQLYNRLSKLAKDYPEHYGEALSAWSSTSNVGGGRRRHGEEGSGRNSDVDIAVMEELEEVNNDDAEYYTFNMMRELDDEIDIVMNETCGDPAAEMADPYNH